MGVLTGAIGPLSEALRPLIGPAYAVYGLLLSAWSGHSSGEDSCDSAGTARREPNSQNLDPVHPIKDALDFVANQGGEPTSSISRGLCVANLYILGFALINEG